MNTITITLSRRFLVGASLALAAALAGLVAWSQQNQPPANDPFQQSANNTPQNAGQFDDTSLQNFNNFGNTFGVDNVRPAQPQQTSGQPAAPTRNPMQMDQIGSPNFGQFGVTTGPATTTPGAPVSGLASPSATPGPLGLPAIGTGIQVVSVPTGIAFWDSASHRLYVYGVANGQCQGVYYLPKLGAPMQQIAN